MPAKGLAPSRGPGFVASAADARVRLIVVPEPAESGRVCEFREKVPDPAAEIPLCPA